MLVCCAVFIINGHMVKTEQGNVYQLMVKYTLNVFLLRTSEMRLIPVIPIPVRNLRTANTT